MSDTFKLRSDIPQTEGIKYTGSKLKLLPYILEITEDLPSIDSVWDGFSGTTRVTQAFAQRGYKVISSDVAPWSEVFASCYLLSQKTDAYYQGLLEHLNNLPGVHGWFTEKYGGKTTDSKRPFQMHNTMRLDAIREELDHIELEWVDKCVLLTSLIYALDRVDSTLGHYVSYLSSWSKRSYNPLHMMLPNRFPHRADSLVYRDDVFNLTDKITCDLAYYDPPYGSNNEKMPPSRVRYSSYYHIWKTVILNDRPKLFGKANRREDSRDTVSASIFEEFKKNPVSHMYYAMEAIDKLVKETQAKYVLLSYSSGGRATKEELLDILASNGKILKMYEIDYKRNIMASMKWTNQWINDSTPNREYLFLLSK